MLDRETKIISKRSNGTPIHDADSCFNGKKFVSIKPFRTFSFYQYTVYFKDGTWLKCDDITWYAKEPYLYYTTKFRELTTAELKPGMSVKGDNRIFDHQRIAQAPFLKGALVRGGSIVDGKANLELKHYHADVAERLINDLKTTPDLDIWVRPEKLPRNLFSWRIADVHSFIAGYYWYGGLDVNSDNCSVVKGEYDLFLDMQLLLRTAGFSSRMKKRQKWSEVILCISATQTIMKHIDIVKNGGEFLQPQREKKNHTIIDIEHKHSVDGFKMTKFNINTDIYLTNGLVIKI